MRAALRLLYNAAAQLAEAASGVVPISDNKTVLALRARRGIRDRYSAWAAVHRDPKRPLVWIHAPSVGEALMARPVITLLRARHPAVQIAFTFFSPSAEQFVRSLDVDFRDYLPFDSATSVATALDALRPDVLVFSKVDVWPELVRQARGNRVRVGMISATLAPVSRRRGGLARLLLRDAYGSIDAVGAVDRADADRLIELGVRPDVITVTGDTQFDQVAQRADAVDRESRLLSALASDRPTLVAGSTWPSDERHLCDALVGARSHVPNLRLIIAPHEMHAAHLAGLERWAAANGLSHARVDGNGASSADVVLVDRFGVLGELYALADVAFVGGGFHDAGLHAVLEPAAFGAPVLFGPRYVNRRDAVMLVAAGAATSVVNAGELAQALVRWLRDDPSDRIRAGAAARAMVETGRGAAERSLELIERLMRS